jgi:hypothetical protein
MPLHTLGEPGIDAHQRVLGQEALGRAALKFFIGSAGDEELGEFGKQLAYGIVGSQQSVAPIEDEGAGRQPLKHFRQTACTGPAAAELPAITAPPGSQRQYQLLYLGGMERLADKKELIRRRHPLAHFDRVNPRPRRNQYDMNVRIQRTDLLGRPQAIEAACEVNINEGHRKGPTLVERRPYRVNGILTLSHGNNIDFWKPLVPYSRAKKLAFKLGE